jgi:hypothetical protein
MPDLRDGLAAAPNEHVGASRSDIAVQDQVRGLLPKALSYLHHLLKIERRRWAIVTGAAFGVALTVGHVVGGVSGLIDGYERVARAWFGKKVLTEVASLSTIGDQLSTHGRALVNELRSEFTRARNKLEAMGSGDFSRAEEALASLHRVDERIGHVWYFEGEIKRVKNTMMFTSKSCPNTLPSGGQIPDFYHQDFYRYLEIARSRPGDDRAGDLGSEICYQQSDGFCIQRTAWIHHLFANDLYQEALASPATADRAQKLKRAAAHAHEAFRYHDPEGVEGFDQCTGTVALEQEIDRELKNLEQKR